MQDQAAPTRQCPICGRTTPLPRCPDDEAVTVVLAGFARDALSFETGDLINDRFRVKDLLGMGGFGAVYSAQHLSVGQAVALKLLGVHGARQVNPRRPPSPRTPGRKSQKKKDLEPPKEPTSADTLLPV